MFALTDLERLFFNLAAMSASAFNVLTGVVVVVVFVVVVVVPPGTFFLLRIQRGENQCPVCRSRIEKVGQAYIS